MQFGTIKKIPKLQNHSSKGLIQISSLEILRETGAKSGLKRQNLTGNDAFLRAGRSSSNIQRGIDGDMDRNRWKMHKARVIYLTDYEGSFSQSSVNDDIGNR